MDEVGYKSHLEGWNYIICIIIIIICISIDHNLVQWLIEQRIKQQIRGHANML